MLITKNNFIAIPLCKYHNTSMVYRLWISSIQLAGHFGGLQFHNSWTGAVYTVGCLFTTSVKVYGWRVRAATSVYH